MRMRTVCIALDYITVAVASLGGTEVTNRDSRNDYNAYNFNSVPLLPVTGARSLQGPA